MGEPDYTIYSLGGCCIFDDMPQYECIECGWKGSNSKKEEFRKSNLEILQRYASKSVVQ
jgi:hypothetical protein